MKNRLSILLGIALVAQGFAFRTSSPARAEDVVRVSAESTVRFILSCEKSNGAFGPFEQEYTDLAWNYPAVHALHLLGESVSRAKDCYRNGTTSFGKTPFWSRYQQRLLGSLLQVDEETPLEPNVITCTTLHSIWCRCSARRTPVENRQEVVDYVLAHQQRSGGFVGGDTKNLEKRSPHVVWTFYGVMTAGELESGIVRKAECIDWLKSCQTQSGGFRWSPDETVHANYEDVRYTWAAVNALKSLGAEPLDLVGCVDWLNSLQNSDGGFGDKPGWRSRLYSTYYAVDALETLTGDARSAIRPKEVVAGPWESIPEGKYRIFQAHSKSPPGGPEMVDAICEMGVDLVGVKAYPHELMEAFTYAKQRGLPVTLLSNPEFYPHRLRFLNGVSGSHVANFMISPDLSASSRAVYEAANRAGQRNLTWPQYQKQVIAPMLRIGTLFWPEWDAGNGQWGLLDAYLMYDDSLFEQPGYNAVHAASKLTGQDRIRLYPWRERYLGLLPFIADCDAHGDIKAYAPALKLYRNVYLAKGNGFEDYLDASINGRSVCVLRTEDEPSAVTYYGATATVAYLKRHLHDWKWW